MSKCPTCERRPSERWPEYFEGPGISVRSACPDPIHDLADRCVAMRGALEFYADEENWQQQRHVAGGVAAWARAEIDDDNGQRAQAALARDEEVSGG